MDNTHPHEDIVAAVDRMQKYIKQNLRVTITQAQLAKAAGYSHYYSSKIFKELVGITPFEYMRRMRLTQAAMDLRDKSIKVIDVALEYVFDSHEGFTRAFSREFGINPKRYANSPVPMMYFLPSNVAEFYHLERNRKKVQNMSNTTKAIFVQVIQRPERKLILKRGKNAKDYYQYCDEVGCDVWGILMSIKEALYEPIGVWLPANMIETGTSEYAQGVEVPMDYSGTVPEGFDIVDMPACSMMIFQGQPYDDEVFEQAISEVWQQIESYDPSIYGYEWAEDDAPSFQMQPMGYRGYIEGKPVRPVAGKAI